MTNPARVDLRGEAEQRVGSCIDVIGVHLHLEGTPAPIRKCDDDVDLVAVVVTPVSQSTAQRLRVDAEVAHTNPSKWNPVAFRSLEAAGPTPSAAAPSEGSAMYRVADLRSGSRETHVRRPAGTSSISMEPFERSEVAANSVAGRPDRRVRRTSAANALIVTSVPTPRRSAAEVTQRLGITSSAKLLDIDLDNGAQIVLASVAGLLRPARPRSPASPPQRCDRPAEGP